MNLSEIKMPDISYVVILTALSSIIKAMTDSSPPSIYCRLIIFVFIALVVIAFLLKKYEEFFHSVRTNKTQSKRDLVKLETEMIKRDGLKVKTALRNELMQSKVKQYKNGMRTKVAASNYSFQNDAELEEILKLFSKKKKRQNRRKQPAA
jgi:hypothetical protein